MCTVNYSIRGVNKCVARKYTRGTYVIVPSMPRHHHTRLVCGSGTLGGVFLSPKQMSKKKQPRFGRRKQTSSLCHRQSWGLREEEEERQMAELFVQECNIWAEEKTEKPADESQFVSNEIGPGANSANTGSAAISEEDAQTHPARRTNGQRGYAPQKTVGESTEAVVVGRNLHYTTRAFVRWQAENQLRLQSLVEELSSRQHTHVHPPQ